MYKRKDVSFEQAVSALSSNGFEIAGMNGIPGRVVSKYGCAAGIDNENALNRTRITAKPGYLIGSEIARLIDRGYQKFLKTSKIEVPATADHLNAMHRFSEELKEATGLTSLYNESLGTVSDRYLYDRVEDRDEARPPVRPWEKT
ncbi:MAG: hypothetical protein ABI383_12130 [Acidobacteriaceae bacterium]